MIFGLNCFIAIVKLDRNFITRLWKSCSNKYQQWNQNHLDTVFFKAEAIDRNWWWVEGGKITKGIPPLIKQKLSKNNNRKMIKLNGNYTLLIAIVMIGNSNYIGTSLSGLIQEVKSNEKLYSTSSKIYYIDQGDRMDHWVGHSLLK